LGWAEACRATSPDPRPAGPGSSGLKIKVRLSPKGRETSGTQAR